MSHQNENLDFSGLFKLDVLIQLNVKSYSFYELGLKKFLAFSSDHELVFIYINSQLDRLEKNYAWDFVDNPIYCMCFEPSGTWVTIVSEEKLLLVPFLPLFIPQNMFDCKWSLSCVTVLPLGTISDPTSMVWWLTKESENIVIIGSKNGTISFYSLEAQVIIGETKVPGDIVDLQMCFDDSLDLLALLISSSKNQHWKLVLEHRSFDYNWLQQTKMQSDKDKKDFMSYIKQLSKDKITLFIQGTSKGDKSQTVEYVLKPTEYLPLFRKGSNNWTLTAQYVNGRHFLSAFETNEGTLILESPEETTPSRTLRPQIKKDDLYIQGLWSQKLVYLLRDSQLEVHSANFSIIQGEAVLGAKRDYSVLWTAELIGKARRAHVMTAKEPTAPAPGWKEPTFLCDLQLPRIALEPCLVVTDSGAFIVNTVSEPCEWLVGGITRGGLGAEQAAAALGCAVPVLLRAAADFLLARNKMVPAHYLYCLAQNQPDGWLARLGVFGKLEELATYKTRRGDLSLTGNAAVTIKLLAILMRAATENVQFDPDVKFTTLDTKELTELCGFAASIGLWPLVPTFSIHRGHPELLLSAIKSRAVICRGGLRTILGEKSLVPLLLEENEQWLFDYITTKCDKFDTTLLKCVFLWLNPLQERLRPVIRDLKQGVSSIYTARMLHLVSTFIHVACALEAREPCPEICKEEIPESDTWKSQFTSRRTISCGLGHFAVVDDGKAKIMIANVPVNTEIIGRVLDVACGRHHTLVLTENGVYAAGDNSYGQLGVGSSWVGATGDLAICSGALLYVKKTWRTPLVLVAAGHYHSAAVDAGGRLYTWGWGVHGQLGLGSIEDKSTPQLVVKFQGRKVLKVGCGSCHTVLLTRNGEVWTCGAAVFGQLGSGNREKSSVPIRVLLPDPVLDIAVGYFHNLALTMKGTIWYWGASPQQVRATQARKNSTPSTPEPVPVGPTIDPHLLPQALDLQNVRGQITKISAGWHHSCLINNMGTIYSWGLNFDGQLGSGDRKQIPIPTEVRIRTDSQPDNVKASKTEPMEVEINEDFTTKALIACGGDFTVYVDEDGRIYSTGNMHMQHTSDLQKLNNKVIMMKTTKRVIKIPTSRNNKKFLFQPIDRIDIMFPFDIEDLQRTPIDTRPNPINHMKDFENKSWADNIIISLSPWIDEEMLVGNLNMAAKLAYHNQMYSKCLKLLLDNLKSLNNEDKIYLTHSDEINESTADKAALLARKKAEQNAAIANVMCKRIKEISLSILNEESYPEINPDLYKRIPCSCDEIKYLPQTPSSASSPRDVDLSMNAANILDKCISLFPVSSELWEACFRLSKNFFLENNLSVSELEKVLRKYMESNATTMADAIMFSKDCAQFNEILSPKLYLNMSSAVLDTWG